MQERFVDGEIEIFVGTASYQHTPFDETFTELIKHTYSFEDPTTKIQVWQALDE